MLLRECPRAPSCQPLGFVDPAPAIFARFDAIQAGDAPRRIRATAPRAGAATRRDMPAPTSLPSLSDALSRRAAVFGPYDGEETPPASLGPWQMLGAAARRAVEALAERVRA